MTELTYQELAALVCAHLDNHGFRCVLSGGGCVSIYTFNKYQSNDLDFIELYSNGNQNFTQILSEIGFVFENGYFKNEKSKFIVEFPKGPLSIGSEPIHKYETLEFKTGKLFLLSVTDCIKGRLAAYYFWNDNQSLIQAQMVANGNVFDLKEIERWSKVEGKGNLFQSIKNTL
jgi:hypothetical protein